ncbi:MAG: hypothetical protein C4542_00505 [Dehalococcoidia bacterium]|nr:MAG: hypothetical protein C4542_00505 [Dehalococcoidia bacterium]
MRAIHKTKPAAKREKGVIAIQTIFPSIIAVAEEHGIDARPLPRKQGEYTSPCPFCGDRGRQRHLRLNSEKAVFYCYRCGRSGGVVTFKSLLSDKSENEVLADCKRNKKNGGVETQPGDPSQRYRKHPAMRLTGFQLRRVGLQPKSQWPAWWLEDHAFAAWWLNEVWSRWRRHLEYHQYHAALTILSNEIDGDPQKAVKQVKTLSSELNVDLLTPVLKARKAAMQPRWFVEAKETVEKFKIGI